MAASRQSARATISSQEMFCFEKSNNIRNSSMTLLLRESRLKMDEWNTLILRTIEAGLMGKWSSDCDRRSEIDQQVARTPMSLKHFYGAATMSSLFLSLAIIAFILEHVVHRKLQDENCHRFWRTIDWIIDGKRHMLKLHPALIAYKTKLSEGRKKSKRQVRFLK